jgi:hypothetical protein
LDHRTVVLIGAGPIAMRELAIATCRGITPD